MMAHACNPNTQKGEAGGLTCLRRVWATEKTLLQKFKSEGGVELHSHVRVFSEQMGNVRREGSRKERGTFPVMTSPVAAGGYLGDGLRTHLVAFSTEHRSYSRLLWWVRGISVSALYQALWMVLDQNAGSFPVGSSSVNYTYAFYIAWEFLIQF